nr:gustatory receptor for sugar taste 64a-like isoform X2 [Danaus plexippus plexippus]
MGLSSRYRRLNECVEVMVAENNRNKNWSKDQDILQIYAWRKIREAYIKQAILVRRVDNTLGGLVLVYNFFNFYFICLQLFYGIIQGISNDGTKNYFFLIDLVWVAGRTIYTILSAADVNKYSTMALPYLFNCQNNGYNIEVQRLQKQLIKNYVALTGMGFYNINRSVVLQMMGTIVTYVLVLVQYDASEG